MNVKQGDLAIVISAAMTPEMIGHIVEVVRPAVNGEKISGFILEIRNQGNVWIVRSQSPQGIAMRLTSHELVYVQERAIADRFLRKVSGLPDTETTDEREPIKEAA